MARLDAIFSHFLKERLKLLRRINFIKPTLFSRIQEISSFQSFHGVMINLINLSSHHYFSEFNQSHHFGPLRAPKELTRARSFPADSINSSHSTVSHQIHTLCRNSFFPLNPSIQAECWFYGFREIFINPSFICCPRFIPFIKLNAECLDSFHSSSWMLNA